MWVRTVNKGYQQAASEIESFSGLTWLKTVNKGYQQAASEIESFSGLTWLKTVNKGYQQAASEIDSFSGLIWLKTVNKGYQQANREIDIVHYFVNFRKNPIFCLSLAPFKSLRHNTCKLPVEWEHAQHFFLSSGYALVKSCITPFPPFRTNVVCSLICFCTLVTYISNNMSPDQTAR